MIEWTVKLILDRIILFFVLNLAIVFHSNRILQDLIFRSIITLLLHLESSMSTGLGIQTLWSNNCPNVGNFIQQKQVDDDEFAPGTGYNFGSDSSSDTTPIHDFVLIELKRCKQKESASGEESRATRTRCTCIARHDRSKHVVLCSTKKKKESRWRFQNSTKLWYKTLQF